MSALDETYIHQFCENGVIVVRGCLNPSEVNDCKRGLEAYLRRHGCDTDNLKATGQSLAPFSSTGGSGGVLDIFYEDWKLRLNEHEKVVSIIQQLWKECYCSSIDERKKDFPCPYGPFNPSYGYMYIDRVCYRVPDEVSAACGSSPKRPLQRSLTPHLDCCPHEMLSSSSRKWRPIQAFIALTDTLQANQGGFEACLGHHRNFDHWASTRAPSAGQSRPPCVGDFTPIRPVEDKAIIDEFIHIPCRAGDMVCWDYRIPHANSRRNSTGQAREAVYIGLLPAIEKNRLYAQEQLKRFRGGLVPVDQWHEHTRLQPCVYEFSELGRRLMTIEDWPEDPEKT